MSFLRKNLIYDSIKFCWGQADKFCNWKAWSSIANEKFQNEDSRRNRCKKGYWNGTAWTFWQRFTIQYMNFIQGADKLERR